MVGRASLDFEVSLGPTRGKRRSGEPQRIVLLGDMSRGGPAVAAGLFERIPVSATTLDDFFASRSLVLDVAINEPLSTRQALALRSLEDLHPDRLIAAVLPLRELSSIVRALGQGASEAAGREAFAAFLGRNAIEAGSRSDSTPANDRNDAPEEKAGSDLERLLGSASNRDQPSAAAGFVQDLINRSLQDDASAAPATSSVSDAAEARELQSLLLRSLLANDALKAVEAAWRSVDWLVRRVDEDTAIVEVIDMSRDQLSADLADPSRLDDSQLSRLLAENGDLGETDLVINLFPVGANLNDLVLLSKLAAIASRAGAGLAAQGDPALIGCQSIGDLDVPANWRIDGDDAAKFWHDLRAHPVAQNFVLCAPQFLLRQPYTPNNDPIDAFEFDELGVAPGPEKFCWGSAALLYAHAYLTRQGVVGDLPMPIYDDGSGQAQQFPTEAFVSDRAAAAARENGLFVMRTNRNTGEVFVG